MRFVEVLLTPGGGAVRTRARAAGRAGYRGFRGAKPGRHAPGRTRQAPRAGDDNANVGNRTRVEPLAAVAVLVLAALAEVCLLVTGAPSYTVVVALAVVAAGMVVGTRSALVVVVASIWAGWGACVVALRGSGWAVPLAGMALATLLCGLAHLLWTRSGAELGRARRAVEVAAVHDPLTGVLNRRGLALLGEQIVGTARRQGDAVHCVLLEVGGLRTVNENLGHRAGDDVLVAVADVLRTATRVTDAVARRDGNTFCVVGPGPGPGSLDLERRVRRDLAAAPPVPPPTWPALVNAACVMLAPWDAGGLEALLGKAAVELRARRALRGGLAPGEADLAVTP